MDNPLNDVLTGLDIELTGLEIEGELGRGSFTTVHRVRRDGVAYALKRPHREAAADPALPAAFQREAALLACVNDPGVARVHAAGRYDDAPALVLEYLPGGSLADQLARGPLAPERVVELASRLARALAAAHRVGLVHRDVKPGNIMTDPDKLIDFGLAQLGGAKPAEDEAVGTFLYASPEQSGMLKRPVDARSDLYSLGVVLFECLTGRLPFEASDVGELLRLHLTAPVPEPASLRPGLDPALCATVMRLLAKDPDDRYQDAAALLADLRECPGGEAAAEPAAVRWPLCGRAAEIERLGSRWARARDGFGGTAVLRGPSGSGRTRVAEEVAALALADGPVLWAACRADEPLPLAALREAVDGYLRTASALPVARRAAVVGAVREAALAAGPALVGRLSARLAEVLGDAAVSLGEVRDDHVFAAVAVFLAELARRSEGLLLVLDDADRLDPGSAQVLSLLSADLPGVPMLVLLTTLDGAPDGGNRPTVDRDRVERPTADRDSVGRPVADPASVERPTADRGWVERPGAEVVECGPLDRAAVDELIASRLPGAAVTPELADHVAARTDGSPFAVVAYLLRLIDAGLLTPMWGTWVLNLAGADALPAADGVRDLLSARLARLPEGACRHLLTAAVAGDRFRTETLIAAVERAASSGTASDGPASGGATAGSTASGGAVSGGATPRRADSTAADDVVAAVAAAVDRRVVEARPGGWFVFMHPLLRESLLVDVPAGRLRELHAALAHALEELPPVLRDADHVYAVARHYQRAGETASEADRHRSALAAGLRALDDRAPVDAVGYLLAAGPATEVLHPLATAYLRSARYEESARTLDRALAAEKDHRARARLLATQIELRHTLWDTDRALESTGAALAELRHPLPGNPLRLVITTLTIAAAGGLVRRTKIGLGTAKGNRRDELAALAAILDAGGYAAGLGLRLREAGLLAMRALYAVNRLGPGPEYVRVYALVGYFAAMIKLRRTALRCLDRSAAVAGELGDPALAAYAEWLRGCAMLFGGHDDGTAWEHTITKHERWFAPAQLIPGHATIGLRLLLRGYTAQARAEYERGLRRLPDPRLAAGSSFSMLGVMIPAIEGQHADAATALAALGAGDTTANRAHLLTAAACAAIEQGEIGAPFEALVAEFRGLGLKPRELMTQMKWFYAFQSHGRMAQLRMATDEQRPEAVEAARRAVRDLRRVRKSSPLLDAAYLIGEAALAQLTGDFRTALDWIDRVEPIARRADAPILHFEVARFRARAFRGLGQGNEAERQARYGLMLATHYGWEQRRRQIRAEFAVDDAGLSHRRTNVDRRAEAGRNRRLEALQQVGAAAATILDPRELARVALDEMLRILGAERALFFLLDDAGRPVHFAGRGADGADLQQQTAYGATLVSRVAESGEALVLTGTEQGAALGSRSAVVHGLRSILVAPVQFKGTTVGVVYLDSRLARGIFTDDDVEVLTAVVGHVAVSLETARAAQLHLAVQAARQQQAFAETLRSSLAELSAIHDPAVLLRRLFATLVSRVSAQAGCLIVGADVVEIAGEASGLGDRLMLPPVLVPTVLDSVPSPLGGAAAVLAVPLFHRDGQAGVALLAGPAFDDGAVQVAAALATQGMSAYDNARLFSRVQELATTDELTGQHNRRHFYAIAGALVVAADRGRHDLAAAMLDIDKFKNINDTYGHGVGDEVIRTVAARIRAAVRQADVLGRYGGEEFAVVLPDHRGDARALAERMRAAVADGPIATAAGPIRVTISVGLAGLNPGDGTLDHLLARADVALYQAKEAGRNQVVEV
ncbi:MAG TPA: diguanylate cyclase [Actinoplanes sp.]